VRARFWLLLTVTAFAVVIEHSSAVSPQHKPAPPPAAPRFGFESVQHLAQQRSEEAYREPGSKLPDSIAKLSYEDYRSIQFRPDNALWRNQAMFEVEFFHRGSTFDRRVNITEVGEDVTGWSIGDAVVAYLPATAPGAAAEPHPASAAAPAAARAAAADGASRYRASGCRRWRGRYQCRGSQLLGKRLLIAPLMAAGRTGPRSVRRSRAGPGLFGRASGLRAAGSYGPFAPGLTT